MNLIFLVVLIFVIPYSMDVFAGESKRIFYESFVDKGVVEGFRFSSSASSGYSSNISDQEESRSAYTKSISILAEHSFRHVNKSSIKFSAGYSKTRFSLGNSYDLSDYHFNAYGSFKFSSRSKAEVDISTSSKSMRVNDRNIMYDVKADSELENTIKVNYTLGRSSSIGYFNLSTEYSSHGISSDYSDKSTFANSENRVESASAAYFRYRYTRKTHIDGSVGYRSFKYDSDSLSNEEYKALLGVGWFSNRRLKVKVISGLVSKVYHGHDESSFSYEVNGSFIYSPAVRYTLALLKNLEEVEHGGSISKKSIKFQVGKRYSQKLNVIGKLDYSENSSSSELQSSFHHDVVFLYNYSKFLDIVIRYNISKNSLGRSGEYFDEAGLSVALKYSNY